MDDKDRLKRIKLVPCPEPGDFQRRALQKVGDAASAQQVTAGHVLEFIERWFWAIRVSLQKLKLRGSGFREPLERRRCTLPTTGRAARVVSRKRAQRATAIDALKKAIRAHLQSARDYAEDLMKRGKPPKLLPRPTQQLLARQLNLSESAVCRALRDESAVELRILWETANSLDKVLNCHL